MATATRVHAAILAAGDPDRVREEELAERIQCFLLVEKRIKPPCGTSSARQTVLLLTFGKTPIYYHECMFNVSYL
jgi:hypothetical protein